MTYDRFCNQLYIDRELEEFFQTETPIGVLEDLVLNVSGSGLHEYNGMSTDWRFTYTGRGYF